MQPWTDIGNLPPHVTNYHMAAAGDYWYAMEGDWSDYPDPSYNQGHFGTLYSQFQSDGTIGPWLSTSSRVTDRNNYREETWGLLFLTTAFISWEETLVFMDTTPYQVSSDLTYNRIIR